MKIFFDCRYVRTDHHDGISRFSARLVEELAPLAQQDGHSLTMLISDERQLSLLPPLAWEKVSGPTSGREPFVARQINTFSPDIVFSPMQTIGARGKKYPLVLTVHDLIYYAHPTPPRQFNWAVRALWRLYHTAWWPQRMLLGRSNAVVAVSETTKKLIAQHKLTTKPVYVVPNAADSADSNHSTASASHRDKSIIYMGSFMPYKNVETLVRAVALLPEFTLHLLSRISDTDQRRLSALAPSAQINFHNGISDEEYFELLGQATALVTASRDEGFGIPLVEAMSVGTPIVVSDIAIFHEIGSTAALYAPSDSPEEFAEHIRALTDPQLWRERSQACLRQSAQFSWKNSAQKLLDVLVEVARA
ncbi:glycosyltransferase involved in cell wall biosynthesis [Aurantimicrobium minutum]|uniref:glycosyltransferase family 4 protein n=1 Tax=Aurantimicrobium minutum TaxID=708131 RepID=UPI0024769A45|nr:glycosyltransferase family 1 protein [Aurantimicrobium minutum]MDH6532908.1 glycosyltransferase involved in cell wall biosynthesis [Aurantimicrobium minutum]